jgi:hypothetical protein
MSRHVRFFARVLPAILIGVLAVGVAPALAASNTTYSGQAAALSGSLAGVTLPVAATGALPSGGDTLEASQLSVAVPGALNADTLHASAIGRGDRTRSEASAAALAINPNNDTIVADFALSRTQAVSTNSGPSVSGGAEIDGLVVNGQSIVVTGSSNQTVGLPDGQIVINEQISSISGNTGSITVNALHITAAGGVNFTVASSTAGVTAGSNNCGNVTPITTGGGFIVPVSGAKQSFGVVAGAKGAGFFGHTLFVDHGTGQQVQGTIDTYTPIGSTSAIWSGQAIVNGQPSGTYQVRTNDVGEPGTGSDTFSITVAGASPAISATGTLSGGNIQQHSKACQ